MSEENSTEDVSKKGKDNGTTINYLLAKIRRNSDFPAFSQHVTEINRLASSDSDTTVIELTNAVLKDYSLTNKLLRLVNSSVYGQFGGQVNTVSRAITILGFDSIRMLAVGLLVFDQVKNRPQVKELMEANMWCFVGAFISRQIVDKSRHNDTEMTFIAALLHKLGTLLVIYYLPDEYEAIRRLVEQKGLTEDVAAKQTLGVPFYVLGQRVGESWGLPPLLLNGMKPPGKKSIHIGTDSSTNVLNMVGFSSSLLDIVKAGEPEKNKKRFTNLLTRYKKVVALDEKQLQSIINSSLEQASELMDFPAEWEAEMRARLSLAGGAQAEQTTQVASSYQKTSDADNDAGSGDVSILLRGINDVTNMMMTDHGLSDILVTILESIYRGLGLNRVVLLINNASKKALVVRFGFAPDLDALKNTLEMSTESPDAIATTLKNKSDLLIEDVSRTQGGIAMPDWYSKTMGANSFGLYPIVIKNALIGAIYFDSLHSGAAKKEDVVHIQSLRNQAALAIKMNS